MFDVNAEKFEEGRAAYVRGASLRGLMEAVERLERAFDQQERERTDGQLPDYRAQETACKSLVLGYADGVIGDIRKLAGSVRGGLRA